MAFARSLDSSRRRSSAEGSRTSIAELTSSAAFALAELTSPPETASGASTHASRKRSGRSGSGPSRRSFASARASSSAVSPSSTRGRLSPSAWYVPSPRRTTSIGSKCAQKNSITSSSASGAPGRTRTVTVTFSPPSTRPHVGSTTATVGLVKRSRFTLKSKPTLPLFSITTNVSTARSNCVRPTSTTRGPSSNASGRASPATATSYDGPPCTSHTANARTSEPVLAK
jgi:hypothetical protein